MEDFLWWRDGVIYQIYPRSFYDTNSDGLGDLPGITARLGYLADLGVDAIWLSPFYPSPDRDFGYDISDHTAVDPRFGTLDDFDALVREAHRLGLRVVLDMVLNHTSDQHPWFFESRSSRENPRRDWYIWRKGKGGGAPNNWRAAFGGRTWTYDPRTGEYYLHLFASQQPDLNWRNPAVRQAQMDVFRFWLERGVDGFRLDVFNAFFKDGQLRDNPTKLGLVALDRQHHIYEMDQPEMIPLLKELRTLLDSYPERYAVGETYWATPQKILSYCGDDRLHAAFSFDFTFLQRIFPWNPHWILAQIERRERSLQGTGIWPTTVLSNHDLPRAASRYRPGEDDRMAKIAMAFLLTLRGTPFLYYGEEIGMRNIPLKRSEIMDPQGKHYWPIDKGRDGCRSPMQWDSTLNAGFTSQKPWLKVHPDYPKRNVTVQQQDPGSLFHMTRQLLALRKATPALLRGEFTPLEAGSRKVLAYLRTTPEQTVLVALNFSGRRILATTLTASLGNKAWELLFSTSRQELHLPGKSLELEPYEVCILAASRP